MTNKNDSQDSKITTVFNETQAAARLLANTDPGVVWLNSYQPRSVTESDWQAIADFVRIQAARLETGGKALKLYANYLAQLTAHAHFTEGVALDVELVLDPDMVERFIATIRTDSARSTIRCRLRRLGRNLTKSAPWKRPARELGRRGISAPYSSAEMRAIHRDIDRQANPRRAQSGRRIVALAAGAGLDGRWSGQISGSDVQTHHGFVTVQAPDPFRTIVVRDKYAEDLIAAATEVGNGLLLGNENRGQNYIADLASRVEIEGGRIRLDARRLRSTWIVSHLQAGVPMADLLYASGVQNPAAFDTFVPYLERSEAGARRLRGGDGL